jgi:hypothetical protein
MLETLEDIEDLISAYYECNYGCISNEKPNKNKKILDNQLGEFSDVYFVAKKKKKLAALDLSTYGKNKFRKLNTTSINQVIEKCNHANVKALHNKKTGGMYLKTIFFLQENYENALKLMDILWNPTPPIAHPIDEQIAIGLLLGYKHSNIIAFIEKNYNITPDKTTIEHMFNQIQSAINQMDVSLEDLNKHSKIVLWETIPTI